MPIIGTHTSPGASPPGDTDGAAGQRAAGAGQTVPCQRDPLPLRQAVSELLQLSDLLDGQLRMRLLAFREGWRAGWAAGYGAGREDLGAELDAAWNAIARPVARGGPSYAELERRRWGPGGREHFADPQPGDYQGRKGAA